MTLETRKYTNGDEFMTVMKLLDDNGEVLEVHKLYCNSDKEAADSDFKKTVQTIDEFLLRLCDHDKAGRLIFDSQVVNVEP
jgi:hypothetical protein